MRITFVSKSKFFHVLFNSVEFLFFLPIVFIGYWFIFNKRTSDQNVWLLVASYFFYGWWSWKFMGLLMLSTILDYAYGFWVASPNRRISKRFLWLSIINNLGILGIFKYYNFFADQIKQGFDLLGWHISPIILEWGLPIGISFYTFHGMSYVFDIYHGRQKPVKSFVEYAVFVSFFPLLVAGPIERANHLLPQVQRRRSFNYTQAVDGCRLILWGMFKKVVVADSLAGVVDEIFTNYPTHDGTTLMVGAIAFSFQIYGDFSGYSDIALGTARLFGFELLSNFKFPYFSRDLAEFWRRWHISLSSWFRDYLYIPLGGSKNGKLVAVRNTFIIFLISGFWHGASWNFITWGFIHACGFLPLLLMDKNRRHTTDVVAQSSALPSFRALVQMLSTFVFVTFAWIFFRAETLGKAVDYIETCMLSLLENPGQLLHLPAGKIAFLYIIPLLIGDWLLRRDERKYVFGRLVALILSIVTMLYFIQSIGKDTQFIYFQF